MEGRLERFDVAFVEDVRAAERARIVAGRHCRHRAPADGAQPCCIGAVMAQRQEQRLAPVGIRRAKRIEQRVHVAREAGGGLVAALDRRGAAAAQGALVAGRAVLWPATLEDDPFKSDSRTHHEALPVLKGVKYAANFWLHQFDYITPHRNGCTA